MAGAFVTPTYTRSISKSWPNSAIPKCQRRLRTPQCSGLNRSTKILAVDLQELLRPSATDARSVQEFSERVSVDRENGQHSTFVLYSSISGYDASMASIRDAGLAEPDALATLNGTDLYQRQYRTPDPFWSKTVCQGWTSKPIVWVAQEFFGDLVAEAAPTDEFEVTLTCKAGAPVADLVDGVARKLEEMGISARVLTGEDGDRVTIVPAASSAAGVIAFCQMMLKIEESSTFVFGGDDLIEKCVGGKGNLGLVCSSSAHDWEAFGDRVFVSKEQGGKALLDGLMHYAVF